VANDYFGYVRAYEGLIKTFNPVKFTPEKWAAAASEAGMKYVVLTTKHHDGFCLFDTKQTDYKITSPDCPFSSHPRSNVVKEVFSTFRKEGFWTGAYFSKPDWHSDYYWWKKFPPSDRNCNYSIAKHPEQWKKFVNYTHAQIGELMSDYGPVDILWLDGGWVRKTTGEEVQKYLAEIYEGSRWARNPQNQDIDMETLVRESRKKQPGLIVVDRAVTGPHQNYLTPENHIPEEGLPYPWETCMPMATSWSYVPNDRYKSANELVEKLVDIVSKGGNFLLNIGPGPDGELDTTAYSRLREIGAWIKVNGEAIYKTRSVTPFSEGERIRFTQSKDSKIQYIFLFDMPPNRLIINKLSFKDGATVRLLGDSQNLAWKRMDNGVEIVIPVSLQALSEHVWTLRVEQEK
jgi:alpha-L-fucosidase